MKKQNGQIVSDIYHKLSNTQQYLFPKLSLKKTA